MAATDTRLDPFRGFNFRVVIDGLPVGAFSEVSGMTVTQEAAEYREGSDSANTVRKLTALTKYGDLTLKRGFLQDTTLWAWVQRIANGIDDRRNGSIILMNEAHVDVLAWNFVNAWPGKIEGPMLNAADNKVTIESLELHHEGVQLEILPLSA
jgi:phage tail-like protein